MLKTAFPDLAGKAIFRLVPNEKEVKVDLVQYNLHVK